MVTMLPVVLRYDMRAVAELKIRLLEDKGKRSWGAGVPKCEYIMFVGIKVTKYECK